MYVLISVCCVDSVSRNLEGLLQKLNAISTYGITTYMWTGGSRLLLLARGRGGGGGGVVVVAAVVVMVVVVVVVVVV